MAHIRQTQFGFPQRFRKQRRSVAQGRFADGVHTGVNSIFAAPYSPSCDNLIAKDGAAFPRPGLGSFTTSIPIDTVAGDELFDVFGNAVTAAVSANTISIMPVVTGLWSTLSRLGTKLSATSKDIVDLTYVNDLANDINLGIVVNGVDTPKFFDVRADALTWSDFTAASGGANSLLSRARTVTVANERLVFANTADTAPAGVFPTRIVWSVRGAPKNFTIASGAGFADPSEMRGQILKLLQDQEGFVILTNLEIWRARPRPDNFAFDFIRLTKEISCPFPKTAVSSPIGVIFLGSDFDVYAIQGAQIKPLGLDERPDDAGERVSRIQNFVEDNIGDGDAAWATYNINDRRYELHLADGRALFYDVLTGSWWPQTFPFALTHGFEITDPEAYANQSSTWDEDDGLWDDDQGRWDDLLLSRPPVESRKVMVFTDTDIYRMEPDFETDTDNALTFTCKWNSPPARASLRNLQDVRGAWIDYTTNPAFSGSGETIEVATRDSISAFSQTLVLTRSTSSVGFVGLRLTGRNPALRLEFPSLTRVSLNAYEIDLTVRGEMKGRF